MAGDVDPFTVMTLNAGGGRRAGDRPLDLEEIAAGLFRLIRTVEPLPGLIAVQEAVKVHWDDPESRQARSAETAQRLVQRLNDTASGAPYRSWFVPCVDSDVHPHRNKWQPPKRPNKYQGYTRVQEGNALIAAKNVAPWPWDLPEEGYPGHGQGAPIRTEISTACLYSTGNRDTQPRNFLVVPVSIAPNASVYFMATHLATLTEENRHDPNNPRSKEASDVRLGQVGEIVRVVNELREAERRIKREPAPIILAGDFNAKPDSPEIQALEQTFLRPPPRWQDPAAMPPPVWTHVGHEIHVDHIFCSDPGGLLSPLDCLVLMPELIADATDHLPVVARFELKAG